MIPQIPPNIPYGVIASGVRGIINNTLTAPPTSPAPGDAYIVAASPTGAWTGQANTIATWSGFAWKFYTPITNDAVGVLTGTNSMTEYVWSGSAWVAVVPVLITRITATGSFTPSKGARSTVIEMVGGGGSGGGVPATIAAQGACATPGATGGYLKFSLTPVQIGVAAITVTIGAGGVAAAAGAVGNAGGATSFGAFATCNGGAAGATSTAGAGPLVGGAGTTGGAVTLTTGTAILSLSGVTTGGALLQVSTNLYLGSMGGSNPLGIGGGYGTDGGSKNSLPGFGYGAGSSGAFNGPSQAARPSVAGQAGVCIITEYF